jgi:MoaA/NifB/PqqE/SkfB family radical SAM enzyme
VRFTMTQDNAHDLPGLLQAGRGRGHRPLLFLAPQLRRPRQQEPPDDAQHQLTRWRWTCSSIPAGTTSSAGWTRNSPPATTMPTAPIPALGARRFPRQGGAHRGQADAVGRQFVGVNVANIDNLGNVHPDTMWWHHTLGNVCASGRSATSGGHFRPADGRPQAASPPVKGRCGDCAYLAICNGNTRVRAQQLTGDPWAGRPRLLPRRRGDRRGRGRHAWKSPGLQA